VDGFNMYHSLKAAERHLGAGVRLRWLDLNGLCDTIMRSTFGPGATLGEVHYFTALAQHLEKHNPDVVRRHRAYISALKHSGVREYIANFKLKERHSPLSHFKVKFNPIQHWWRIRANWIWLYQRMHEEKETDVAIAAKLFELLGSSPADAVVVITGDTDLVPAIKTARRMYKQAEICVALPFKRHNNQLHQCASRAVKIGITLYQQNQLPDTVTLAKGKVIKKPDKW
jgi:uncharacterized LabA/DUF88 family protein